MLEIDIPGFGLMKLKYLVTDYTGTFSEDGILLLGVKEQLIKISRLMEIHVLTSDTFGKAASQLKDVQCKLHILEGKDHDIQKEGYVRKLGPDEVVAFGNGNNDRKMLKTARLGIAVILAEGCAVSAIQAADIVVKNTSDGLDLLLRPLRCKATLRF